VVDEWAHGAVDPGAGDAEGNGVCGSALHALDVFLPDRPVVVVPLADVDEGRAPFCSRTREVDLGIGVVPVVFQPSRHLGCLLVHVQGVFFEGDGEKLALVKLLGDSLIAIQSSFVRRRDGEDEALDGIAGRCFDDVGYAPLVDLPSVALQRTFPLERAPRAALGHLLDPEVAAVGEVEVLIAICHSAATDFVCGAGREGSDSRGVKCCSIVATNGALGGRKVIVRGRTSLGVI